MPLTTFFSAVSASSTPWHLAVAHQLAERLEHQVRVDRAGAVADQRGEVMDLARLAGLEHEPGLQARALAHEVMVDAADRQQRRHRRALGARRAVGQDQDVDAVGERLVGLGADPLERPSMPSGPSATGHVMSIVRARNTSESTWRSFSSSALRRIGVSIASCQACSRRLVEQVALGADAGRHAHHDRLADRVDRRVGDLREELLEVGEQRRVAVAEHGQREVVAHRADRLLAARGGRRQQDLACPPACSRTRAAALRSGSSWPCAGSRSGRSARWLMPLSNHSRYGCRDAISPLDLAVLDDAAAREVDEEDVAGLQAALAQDVLGRLVDHAGLGARARPSRPWSPASGRGAGRCGRASRRSRGRR